MKADDTDGHGCFPAKDAKDAKGGARMKKRHVERVGVGRVGRWAGQVAVVISREMVTAKLCGRWDMLPRPSWMAEQIQRAIDRAGRERRKAATSRRTPKA